MNPLQWKREHLAAWLAVSMIGALLGLAIAWFSSGFFKISTLPGPYPAGYPSQGTYFLYWIAEPQRYWPWPLFGFLIFGLAFYAGRLLKL